MVQALVNNLNIDLTQEKQTPERVDNNFEQLFDTQISLTKGTLGDLKAKFSDTQNINNTSLDEAVKEACQEIIEEGALDLSLENLTIENTTNTEENLSEADNSESVDNTVNSEIINTYSTDLLALGIQKNDKEVVISTENEDKEDSQLQLSENLDSTELTSSKTTDLNIKTANIAKNINIAENSENKKTSITQEKRDSIEEIIDEDMVKELKIESIRGENSSADNNSDGSIMQNQTLEEHGIKAMLDVDSDFASKLDAQITESQVQQKTTTQEITPSKIIEQVTKQMEGMKGGSRVNIVLNPESLGKVSIQLINTKEGLSAQFTVATQEAREILMKGLEGLKETLAANGISVENASVKLSESQNSEYNTDWTEQEGSRGGNKKQNPQQQEKDKEQFEQALSFIEEENGKV